MSDDAEQVGLDEVVEEYAETPQSSGETDERLITGVAWSEIPHVPEDWEVNNIESDIEIQTGDNFSSEEFDEEEGIPLIRIRDLGKNETETNYVGEYDDKHLIEDFDLLVGMDGEFEPHFWLGGKALLNQRVCKIEPKSEYDNFFLRYAMEKPLLYIQKSIAGTTVKHLSQKNINRVNLPTPPLPEQRKIASVLYNVDEAIRKTEEIIEGTKRVKKGVMQDLFVFGLDENGQLRRPNEEPELFRESEHGEIPEKWGVVTLSKLVPDDAPITYGIVKPGDHYPGGVPIVKVEDIIEGQIDEEDLLHTDPEIHEKYDRAELKGGDLLVSIRGTVGRMGFVPDTLEGGNITQDTARVRVENANPQYIRYYLETGIPQTYFERNTIGQAVQGINLEALRETPVLLPDENEQERIVEVVDSYTDYVQTELSERDRLHRLKRALMQNLLTGEVRTKDRDIDVLPEVEAHG